MTHGSTESAHVAVMTSEVIDAVKPHPGGVYIDCTLGGGTHTAQLLERSAPNGRVLSLDVDLEALDRAKRRFADDRGRWIAVEGNFRHLAHIAREHGCVPVDGIILDLGFSSDELENPETGLSFRTDGPLDMRFGKASNEDALTAAQIVNTWPEEEIADVIREYGEERYADRIAAKIVAARRSAPILRTVQLADVIAATVPKGYERGRIHPATRTFQALRIAVNDEIGALKDALQGAGEILAPGGRIAVISFHSLEDRVVKQKFKGAQNLVPLTKRPLVPTDTEAKENPRARSAKLRVAEKQNGNTKTQTSSNKYKKR